MDWTMARPIAISIGVFHSIILQRATLGSQLYTYCAPVEASKFVHTCYETLGQSLPLG